MDQHSTPIQVGVDFASMKFRVAYVFPDQERAVVSVPITHHDFRPCFPICERPRPASPTAPCFFPGLSQRVERDFELLLGGGPMTTPRIVRDLLHQAVRAACGYSAREVSGIMLAVPAWESVAGRDELREALRHGGMPPVALCNDVDAAAAYARADIIDPEQTKTVLYFSAGYTGLRLAVMRFTPRGVRVLAQVADQGVLAGNGIDYALLLAILTALHDAGATPNDQLDYGAWTTLQRAVEQAKEAMKEGEAELIPIPEGVVGSRTTGVSARLDGAAFRGLVGAQVIRALTMVDELLTEADMRREDVGEILLEGGTTHLTEVQRRVAEWFPQARVRHLPPDALAAGAARIACDAELATYKESTVAASSDFYLPPRVLAEGLVTLLGPSLRSAPRLANGEMAPPRGSTPPAAEPPIEHITLAELLAPGRDSEELLRRLVELRNAVDGALQKLTPEPRASK